MDLLLPTGFSPNYSADETQDVLALEDAFMWLDSLSEFPHSLPVTGSEECRSSSLWTSLPLPDPASFQLPLSGSSTSHSAPSSSRSLEDHPRHSNGNGYASSESPSSSLECGSKGKRARVSLDPCQPLTVKGKPRARVYLACRECRDRKVRCDGAKPVCFHCSKRDPDVEACDYDPAPRRRGQDKVPGSRTRSAKGQRASRRAQAADNQPDPNRQQRVSRHRPGVNLEAIIQDFDPTTFDPTNVASYELPAPAASDSFEDEQEATGREQKTTVREAQGCIANMPSVQFARETWWDALLAFYGSHDVGSNLEDVALAAQQRLTTTGRVFIDIRAVLRASVYWASFLHLPRLFETLLDPARRNSVQPSLLLSMLGIGAHVQSSELRQGATGRARAQKLIDWAHSALEASLSANWVDIGLVQAAWFMAYFEMQGHPQHNWDRVRSSISLLDSLIQLFSLTTLDVDRPEAHYAIFATYARGVGGPTGQPMFDDAVYTGSDPHRHPYAPTSPPDMVDVAGMGMHIPRPARRPTARCACTKYTLKQQWPTVSEVAPLWEGTAMWPDGLSEGEVRKEESRRLVWSSVMLSAGQNAYASADAELDRTELFMKDYRNYAVAFPGEALCRSGAGTVWQNNVWNLCLRAMVLWNTSVRQRGDVTLSPEARAEYAMNAWLEADAIEAALDQHTCHLEGGMLYQTREYLFSARMCVSHEFRLYVPEVTSLGIMTFYRGKAEAWLRRQMWVSQELWNAAQEDPNCEMVNRPLLCYWFLGHIVRALILHKNDPTLLLALEAAKVHIKPLEVLLRIWPCDEQRQKWSVLRPMLVQACLRAGVPPPESAVPVLFDVVARKSPSPVATAGA